MKIGIEAKVLTPQAAGIGRYAANLLRALLNTSATKDHGLEFVLFTGPQTSRVLLEDLVGGYCEYFCRAKSSVLRSIVSLPFGIARTGVEVFHGLDHVGIPLFGKRGKYVVTIHDVIPLILPHMFPAKHRWVVKVALTRVTRQADMVIVPSQAVKADVLWHLGIEEDRLVVIPEGCEAHFGPEVEPAQTALVRTKYGLPDHYVLFVGTLEPRKNVHTLLQAFHQLRHTKDVNPALCLVIAGARGWRMAGLYRAVKALGLEDVVLFPGYIEEADLPAVYRGAVLFVFPSLYEGFGLPIVEAMGCGVPVIASNTSAMPEVAGDAALLVAPCDVAGMAAAMQELLHNEALRQHLRYKGLARAQSFSWEAAALTTMNLYVALGGKS